MGKFKPGDHVTSPAGAQYKVAYGPYQVPAGLEREWVYLVQKPNGTHHQFTENDLTLWEDPRIEAVAKAMYESCHPEDDVWSCLVPNWLRDDYRDLARAALETIDKGP